MYHLPRQREIFDEIIVDNFAGGGGASSGISVALGRSVDIAINHDPAAIAMHKANHPDTEHYCESVWDVDPVKATGGRPVALCWFSPDCKHFSKAKGGKPVEKKIRGLAWIVLKWAAMVMPRVIMLENVEEFQTWGPVRKGKPVKKLSGSTFLKWKSQLEALGYTVEHRELVACDYGAPTIRKRFFLIARRDGRPIVWPEPTHGGPNSEAVKTGSLHPWRTAAEIIDWSLPCPSIFERKKQLAENTLRRIARGIQKFVIDSPNPFIIKVNHHGVDFRGQKLDEPLQTITAKNGWGIVTPFVAQTGQSGFCGDRRQYDIRSPLTTIVTKAEHLLIAPTLIQTGYGEREGQQPRALDLSRPLGTVVAGGTKHAIIETALILRQFGKSVGHEATDPLGTVTAGGGGKSQLVSAVLVGAGGPKYMGKPVPVDEPMRTVITENHRALVTTFLTKYHGLKSPTDVRGQMPDEPIKTVDMSNRFALVSSHLVKMKGTNIGQSVTEPLQTITASGLHFGEVRAFLLKYYSTAVGQSIEEPVHTITSKDHLGLVTIQGQDYQIIDIGMRMLEPHELFAAQGFPSDYIIDRDCDGKKYPKSAQVARCGNAVPPPFAEALVRANLPELCIARENQKKTG